MTQRVVRGGAMEFQYNDSNISIEHIKPGGNLPDWLFNYHLKLAKWNDIEDEILPRIMTIYANEESRKQALLKLSEIGKTPLDSSLHMTITRLIDTLHSDLRLPRIIDDDGILFEIIHSNCIKTAANSRFPILHSNEKVEWSRGKTRMLDQLHQRVFEENLPKNWEDDPGIFEYENLLLRVEKQMAGTHPRLRLKKIIKKLKENTNLELFSLRDVEGIIIQDLSPTLSPAKLELLQILSMFKPIHQLCNPGSFRLGEHGAYIADVEVCKNNESMPSWVPNHELSFDNNPSDIFHLGLFNSLQTNEAIHDILSSYSKNLKNKSVMIIDSRPEENREKWSRLFETIGIKIDSETNHSSSLSVLSWLGELMKLGDGQDAWSCDKLKMILSQNSFSFKEDYLFSEPHPSFHEYLPIADIKLLEETARTFHILGGKGSLNDWLYALSQEKFDNPFLDQNLQRKTREQTQWWLLSIANLILPLLDESDRDILENKEYYIGCNSKRDLPRFNFSDSGDEWLIQIIQKLEWDFWTDTNSLETSIVAIQKFINLHTNLRKIQTSSGIKYPSGGKSWIDESIELINSISIKKNTSSDKLIRILTPQNSLGCSADLVILLGLGNEDWDLSIPYFPWLDFEQLRNAGLLNPDRKIRAARHFFNHILSSGKQILLLDPSIDEMTFPCTPFAEWLNQNNRKTELIPSWFENKNNSWMKESVKGKEIFVFNPEKIIWKENQSFVDYKGSTLRSIKQKNGVIRRLKKEKIRLINENSSLIMHENELLQDRIKREPIGVNHEEFYLDWSERKKFVSSFNLKLIPSKNLSSKITRPRNFEKWPVIGRRINNVHSTISIDPRPLEVDSLGIGILDERSGHANLINLNKKIIWSPSKLNKWIQCPRRGWLESELNLSKKEIIEEDLDIRTRGDILHDTFSQLICSELGFKIGEERSNLSIRNISEHEVSLENLMSNFVKILSEKTPWIWRTDAMAVHRRRDFIGMTLDEYEKWWEDNNPPIKPGGRLGQMLISELNIRDSINLAFEWNLSKNKPILIESPDKSSVEQLLLRGWIDRVDLIPFEDGSLINEDGDKTTAPFLLNNWKPRRLILIRDIKSVEGPSKGKLGEKHERGIFEDTQLALYARAWELANPGDLVIGAGITEVGDFTTHYLEIDPEYKEYVSNLKVGVLTDLTHEIYKFPNEESPAKSNPFRAWIFWKLMISFKASYFANEGFVHPTPGKYCDHCAVKSVCR